MMEHLTQSVAVLLNILISLALCNARPVPEAIQTGGLTLCVVYDVRMIMNTFSWIVSPSCHFQFEFSGFKITVNEYGKLYDFPYQLTSATFQYLSDQLTEKVSTENLVCYFILANQKRKEPVLPISYFAVITYIFNRIIPLWRQWFVLLKLNARK